MPHDNIASSNLQLLFFGRKERIMDELQFLELYVKASADIKNQIDLLLTGHPLQNESPESTSDTVHKDQRLF